MKMRFAPAFVNKWLPKDPKNALFSAFGGFRIAFKSFFEISRSPEVQQRVKTYLFTLLKVLIPLYALCFFLLFFLLPVALIFPGVTLQLFLLVPLWAANITSKLSPAQPSKLFLARLNKVNSDLSSQLGEKLDTKELSQGTSLFSGKLFGSLWTDARKSWHFTKYSLFLSFLSLIPLVGTFIAGIGEAILVAEQLGLQLLKAPLETGLGFSWDKERLWLRERRWTLLGFTLPYTFILSLPIVGIIAVPFAQAGAADLLSQIKDKKDEEFESNTDNKGEQTKTQESNENKQEQRSSTEEKKETSSNDKNKQEQRSSTEEKEKVEEKATSNNNNNKQEQEQEQKQEQKQEWNENKQQKQQKDQKEQKQNDVPSNEAQQSKNESSSSEYKPDTTSEFNRKTTFTDQLDINKAKTEQPASFGFGDNSNTKSATFKVGDSQAF